jgi:hypothetical protein
MNIFAQKKMLFGILSRNFAILDEKANSCLFSKVGGGPEIDLPEMWYFEDLLFADPVFCVFCGLQTSF